ncbi:putative pre-mRNA-processing protein 40A-like isoform X2 [Capsicum annuum]|nr:putative pre-mRNA-processing protein 40A-like isoform X2 [Capsicum annuum]
MCINSDVNIDPDGIVLFSLRYYYNKVTRTSEWRMPDEVKNVKKDAVITKMGGATPSDEKTVELGPLVYKSKAVMRAVINDRRYGALKSFCERKQAFNEYLSRKNKLEAEERCVKQKKAQEDFRIMLKIKDFAAYLAISSNTSGSTAKDLFTDIMDELEKQREKNELQSVLEKELDRRSNDWSLKLEKYQIDQHRLHERERELAEQNVYLQREVSSFNEKEVDNRIKMSFLEKHLEDFSKRIEQVSEKNQNQRQQLTQLQVEYKVAQHNRYYVRENYQEKVKELKSGTLLTAVLKENLYSKEMDIKQLQADLARTVRGNDIFKCEVQNALDAFSYATPKLKYLELQVLKKDENINQLTNDLQECMKELGVVKVILPKVFQERDFMYYYNKVTRTSKWRMPDEVKVMLDLNPIWLAHEKDTISHASDFRSIFVVKTSSPGADGSLVLEHGAKSSPIAMNPDANLPTIVASESSSLSGKVSSPMIETVEMKNSSEPTSTVVANSEKIGIAVTLGNSIAPPVAVVSQMLIGEEYAPNSNEDVKKDAAITEIGGITPSDEKTVELGPLVCESKAEAKSAFKTLLESANIGSDCTWDQAMRAVINDQRYGALKSLCEQNKAISIFEHDERFKAIERDKDREDLFEDYVEELEKKVKLLCRTFL